ncbi:ABC transporter ATP-binding protein [Inediibacterium massiliense]|uniref:ABC transporter ATP-binding protein n=1 Tax=Inediibacterium massiliense TaxID=1658111 RepID=UPI002E8E4405|nr:ABC transporter ATP-binding protein [Inediibacterium massiliense]
MKDVRKVYRVGDEKVVALNHVSLEIKQGEVCCFLGTSGSGKSTLLNLMAGLEKPTKGTIKINGHFIQKMNEKQLAKFRQKYVGFIFQSYNLLPALTALENVSLPLTFRGIGKRKRAEISKKMLEAVGLKKYITHKPTQMSGGQQQRVGIARAFVSYPPIVFADEPTGNLDSKTTHEVMKLMLEMAREHNETLIIVTHDKSIAEYADKIVYILDGDIQKVEEKNKGENYEKEGS